MDGPKKMRLAKMRMREAKNTYGRLGIEKQRGFYTQESRLPKMN